MTKPTGCLYTDIAINFKTRTVLQSRMAVQIHIRARQDKASHHDIILRLEGNESIIVVVVVVISWIHWHDDSHEMNGMQRQYFTRTVHGTGRHQSIAIIMILVVIATPIRPRRGIVLVMGLQMVCNGDPIFYSALLLLLLMLRQ